MADMLEYNSIVPQIHIIFKISMKNIIEYKYSNIKTSNTSKVEYFEM